MEIIAIVLAIILGLAIGPGFVRWLEGDNDQPWPHEAFPNDEE